MRIPLIAAMALAILSILLDGYIWGGIKRALGIRSKWAMLYLVSSVLCWLFLIATYCIPRRSADGDILIIMWMLYAYLSVYIVKFCYVIFSIIGLWPLFFKHKPWKTGIVIGVPLGLVCFIAIWYGAIVGRKNIDINRVVIESSKLPSGFNEYRIVQFSDAHVGTWGNDTLFISHIVDSINSLKPDLILFTGDIVNRKSVELEPFVNIFRRLRAKDGVYSVLGNHDYGDYVDWPSPKEKEDNLNYLKKLQQEMGWHLLNNEKSFIVNGTDSIAIIGVENWGEPPFKQYGDLNKAYPYSKDSVFNVNDKRFKILLSHNPEHWNQHVSKETNINLTLSGHTHAMQLILRIGNHIWSPSKYKYEQWAGLYQRSNNNGEETRVYVNIGSGEVGMPFRIGANPEITEITLLKTL